MMLLLLLLLIIAMIFYNFFMIIKSIAYKVKINHILNEINIKEDLLYLRFKDFLYLVIEVLKRKGYEVQHTDRCGIDGSGLKINGIQFAEVWKHGLSQIVDVELAMNLAKCMRSNSIYKGMLITLGDFKPITKSYCYKSVIECINGDRLLEMCKEVQKKKAAFEAAK